MYALYIVKRTQIYIDDAQDRRLAERAATTGATKSKLIREAIDAYLDGGEGEEARLARFRAAARAAAGSAPYLPPGREYVEALREADAERQRELERRWRGSG
jgi:predicted DNA-binding protein